MSAERATVEFTARIRVPQEILDRAMSIYPNVLSTLQAETKCMACGKCCCAHMGGVVMTIMGDKWLQKNPDSHVAPIMVAGADDSNEDARLGIEKCLNWVTQQPPDALPATDFDLPAYFGIAMSMSPTKMDDLPLGVEASNFYLLDTRAMVPDAQPLDIDPDDPRPEKRKVQKNKGAKAKRFCGFCKVNREKRDFWRGHPKEVEGVTTCPILRNYVCPLCQATGDNAHTLKYCPTRHDPEIYYRPLWNSFGKMK